MKAEPCFLSWPDDATVATAQRPAIGASAIAVRGPAAWPGAHPPVLGQRAGGPSRRWCYVTILFSDLCGSVALAEQLGEHRYVNVVRLLRTVARDVVARSGGTIARLQGDGILAFFHGDRGAAHDARQAIMCALALHAGMRDCAYADTAAGAPTLALHSGIHAGLTYLEAGDIERGRYDLIGCTPNLAARLSALAGRDEIVASDVVVSGQAPTLRTGRMRRVQPRGSANPLRTFPVLGLGADAVAFTG